MKHGLQLQSNRSRQFQLNLNLQDNKNLNLKPNGPSTVIFAEEYTLHVAHVAMVVLSKLTYKVLIDSGANAQYH